MPRPSGSRHGETGSLQGGQGLRKLCEQAIASQGRAQETRQGGREESSFAPPATSPPCVASSTTSPQCGVPQALGVRELARVLCLCPAPPRGAPSLLGVLGVLGTPRQHRGHVLSRPFASHCMDVAELGASAGHCPHF